MSGSPPSSDRVVVLARRLGLIGAAAAGGGFLMALGWAFYGRSIGPEALGPAMFVSSVSLWWGLFAVIGIAASAGALLTGRLRGTAADARLRWGALLASVLLLAAGRFLGAIPF